MDYRLKICLIKERKIETFQSKVEIRLIDN